MERDEAGTLEALKSRRRNILAPILTEHHAYRRVLWAVLESTGSCS